jgi:hypothetical protein
MRTVKQRQQRFRTGLKAGLIALVCVILLLAFPTFRNTLSFYAWAFVIASNVYCIGLCFWGMKHFQK